jgi:CheY-like chemotaxis protein
MNLEEWQVLVVDDEPDALELIRDILEYQGIFSIGCASVAQALEAAKEMAPTLLIIDLALPDVDGWGLLAQLQSSTRLKEVPRVAITSYHSIELANKAIEAGFDAYFPKPIDATSFVRELQTIVAR